MKARSPLEPVEGYLPLEDFGLIGDGVTAGLVGRDGSLAWLCLPRFDSPPVFCSLLDRSRGGAFRVAPQDLQESRQFYDGDTGILVTEMRSASGLMRLTDLLTLHSGTDLIEDGKAARQELLRSIEVISGRIRLVIEIDPRGGASVEPRGGGLRLRCSARPDLELHLAGSVSVKGRHTVVELEAGERAHVFLRWGGGGPFRHHALSADQILDSTRKVWQRWIQRFDFHGPQEPLVRRSAITLKLLDHFENGAILAAPTSSLPEAIGGPRNWDYRYCWIRDAAFSVYALRRVGLDHEAAAFLGWVMDVVEPGGRPRVLYNLMGQLPPPEEEDAGLEGYRRSRPVRWGNAAAEQRQHDVYGEILDCAYQWAARGGTIDPPLWARLKEFIEAAAREWSSADQGIWEVRTEGRPFTYSAALCQVALDRGARLAERLGLEGDVTSWRRASEKIRQAVLEEAWDEERKSITEHLGGGGLDGSLLALPLRRVIPADDPRMIATTEAIREGLGAGDGLLYRYLPEESPDGLAGHEGAFLLCSFWLVDNLAKQSRLDEAGELFESLCGRANALGLLPEQIDPSSGAFLGNYPQAFSHVGVISSAVNLARLAGNGGG